MAISDSVMALGAATLTVKRLLMGDSECQMTARCTFIVFLLAFVLPTASGEAQSQPGATTPERLTIEDAIQYAADHYPSIRAGLAQIEASTAAVAVARSTYLPRLDSVWQSNRATANNVFGQVLPQSVMPALTGPVLAAASQQSVWGSAAGALLSWEPVDFGLRHASVVGAETELAQARAAESLTRLDVENAVAQGFLAVLAAQQTISATRADLDRREVFLRSVEVLVTNELRPGADASRAEAERAAATIRLLQAQQVLAVAEANLRRLLGAGAASVVVVGGSLLARLPGIETPPESTVNQHPLAQVHRAAVDQARAIEDVLAHSDRPRILVQSSVFMRGSGANPNGTLDGSADGLGFDRVNWAAGVQVVFPNLFDFKALHARQAAAAASERASAALYDEALLAITTDQQAAAALVQAARAIAANTPLELAAAQQTASRARARYDAGLTSIVEVAEAQSLLAQAEVQDQIARVDVWRALLAAAVAQGDLAPFLNLVRQL